MTRWYGRTVLCHPDARLAMAPLLAVNGGRSLLGALACALRHRPVSFDPDRGGPIP